MIYFIDDDLGAFRAWVSELEARHHTVRCLRYADEAFSALRALPTADVEVALIDVMLGVEDPASEQFDVDRTDEYLETGLRLLEDLAIANPLVFPRRAILLTNTINPTTFRAARATSSQLGVPLWQKPEITSPRNFADRVGAFVSDLAREAR